MRKKRIKQRKYYVMFGFEERDPEHTAYLKIEKNKNYGNISKIYSYTYDVSEATIFSEKNYKRKKGFGTPEQWAYFFAKEKELENWNFHPVVYAKNGCL